MEFPSVLERLLFPMPAEIPAQVAHASPTIGLPRTVRLGYNRARAFNSAVNNSCSGRLGQS
jgi:hypothetical protein